MRCKHCGKPIRGCHLDEDKECYEPVYFRVLCEMVSQGKEANPQHRCYLATINETKLRMSKK